MFLACNRVIRAPVNALCVSIPGSRTAYKFTERSTSIAISRIGSSSMRVCRVHLPERPRVGAASVSRVVCVTDVGTLISWEFGGTSSRLVTPFGTTFSSTMFAAGTLTIRSLNMQFINSIAVGSAADVVVSPDSAYVVPHNPNEDVVTLKPVGRRFSCLYGAEISLMRELEGLPWAVMKVLLLAGKFDRCSLPYILPHELLVKILCTFTCMRVASLRKFSILANRGLQRFQVSDIGGGFLEVVGSRPPCPRPDIRSRSLVLKFPK